MKYFTAYLKEKKNPVRSQGNALPELTKGEKSGPLSVLAVTSDRNVSKMDAVQAEETARPSGNRDFLGRPLGREENPDTWAAWTPFMLWLLENHPEHYHAICSAEDVLNMLEREGMADGLAYDLACQDLHQRFETARRLALRERSRVWEQ